MIRLAAVVLLYLAVFAIIKQVLTALLTKGGVDVKRYETLITCIAFIWPLWGEFVLLLVGVYLIYKAVSFMAADSKAHAQQNASQPPSNETPAYAPDV